MFMQDVNKVADHLLAEIARYQNSLSKLLEEECEQNIYQKLQLQDTLYPFTPPCWDFQQHNNMPNYILKQ